MSLTLTLILLAVGGALTGLFGWLGARPKVPGRPRLAPWQFLMMLSAAFALLMAVHLLNLAGVHTGNQVR